MTKETTSICPMKRKIEATTTKADHQQKVQKDVISCLPEDILLRIIDHLSMQEAARTTTLSKRWRPLFYRIPTLSFEGLHQYDSIVSILRGRKAYPITNCLVSFRRSDKQEVLENVISNICGNVVEKLSLKHVYTVPSCLFLCSSLVALNLMSCSIMVSGSPVALPRLKKLELVNVHIEDGWLETTIPLCARLEELIVRGTTQVNNFVLYSKSLLTVRFIRLWRVMRKVSLKEATSLREVEIVAPQLGRSISDGTEESNCLLRFLSEIQTVENLSISCPTISCKVFSQISERMRKEDILNNVKKLVITIDLSDVSANLFLSCLLHRCPKLEELWVENSSDGVIECPQDLFSFWETQKPSTCLFRLRNLALKSLNDNDNSFAGFTKFLRIHAKVSETATVCYKLRSKIHLETLCGRCGARRI